jgi:glycosyltransferase involved in cell wall biosynthesis
VVKVGDVGAMVDRLSAILHDRQLRERQSRAGLATVERYSLARVAPLFADALARAATS